MMKSSLILIGLFSSLIGSLNGAAVDTGSVTEEQQLVDEVTPALLDINEDCHQPKEIGRCFALFHRYAFNVESRQCEEFIYGGCSGNKNNFESKEDCEQICVLIERTTTEGAVLSKDEVSTEINKHKA